MSLPSFDTLDALTTLADRLPEADSHAAEAARARQNALTKPPGSLGRLEQIAEFMAAWRATARPEIWRAQALVFAGNHGICAQGVNPYPQEVTAQMVANFEAGGAAINQLCRANGADLSVVALELGRLQGLDPLRPHPLRPHQHGVVCGGLGGARVGRSGQGQGDEEGCRDAHEQSLALRPHRPFMVVSPLCHRVRFFEHAAMRSITP